MMAFIEEWAPKLGVKIVCSQVRCPATASRGARSVHACKSDACTLFTLNFSCNPLWGARLHAR